MNSTVYTSILDGNKKELVKKHPRECFYGVPTDFVDGGKKAVYVRYYPQFETGIELTKLFYTFAETFPFFKEKEETYEELLENQTVTINARKVHSRKLLSVLFLSRYPQEFPQIVKSWEQQESREKHPFLAFVKAHNVDGMYNYNHTFFEYHYPEGLDKIFDPREKKFMKGLEDKFLGDGKAFYQRGQGFTEFYQDIENYKSS